MLEALPRDEISTEERHTPKKLMVSRWLLMIKQLAVTHREGRHAIGNVADFVFLVRVGSFLQLSRPNSRMRLAMPLPPLDYIGFISLQVFTASAVEFQT